MPKYEKQTRQRQKKRRRIPKVHRFEVTPLNPAYFSRKPKHARVAMVNWENGRRIIYRFDHLTKHELDDFWRMSDSEKRRFFKTECNKHHRKPRCQNGETTNDNLSYVDIHSHVQYNYLVKEVACWKNCWIKQVESRDIARFLKVFYQELRTIATNPATDRIVGLHRVLKKHNNMRSFSNRFLVGVSKWSGMERSELELVHVHKFIRRMYFPIRRLAFDCESGRLRALSEFVRVLNAVWIPKTEPIVL